MLKTAAIVPDEEHLILSTVSPGAAQKRLALAVVLGLVIGFVLIAAGPLGSIQTKPVAAFVPAYATAMFVCDSIDGDSALCPVFDSALARHPRHCEWISFHSAHPHSLDPGVSWGVCAERWTHWRFADHVVAISPSMRAFLCSRSAMPCRRIRTPTHGPGGARHVRRSL